MTLPSSVDAAEPVLRLTDLVSGYEDHRVCGPITASLDPGRSLALIGPNGSGKSTVLRTAAGQQPALDGETRILGRLVDDRDVWFRRQVAIVFDDDAFFPALTVREHLGLVAVGHSVEDADAAVARELDFFGLSEGAESFPLTLSSGQRRRFLLAAAFIRPFDLLVLDEPEQRLDARMRQRLAERLRSLTDAGSTVLFATHDPSLLTTAADSALLVGDEVRELTPVEAAETIGS